MKWNELTKFARECTHKKLKLRQKNEMSNNKNNQPRIANSLFFFKNSTFHRFFNIRSMHTCLEHINNKRSEQHIRTNEQSCKRIVQCSCLIALEIQFQIHTDQSVIVYIYMQIAENWESRAWSSQIQYILYSITNIHK